MVTLCFYIPVIAINRICYDSWDRVQAVLKAKGGHTMYYKNIVAFHQHKDSIFKFCRQRTTEISVQKLKKHCSVCVNTVLYQLLIVAASKPYQRKHIQCLHCRNNKGLMTE